MFSIDLALASCLTFMILLLNILTTYGSEKAICLLLTIFCIEIIESDSGVKYGNAGWNCFYSENFSSRKNNLCWKILQRLNNDKNNETKCRWLNLYSFLLPAPGSCKSNDFSLKFSSNNPVPGDMFMMSLGAWAGSPSLTKLESDWHSITLERSQSYQHMSCCCWSSSFTLPSPDFHDLVNYLSALSTVKSSL